MYSVIMKYMYSTSVLALNCKAPGNSYILYYASSTLEFNVTILRLRDGFIYIYDMRNSSMYVELEKYV